MKKMPILLALVALLVVFTVIIYRYWLNPRSDAYASKRLLKYSFIMQNPGNELVKQASFWVYLPPTHSNYQNRLKLTANYPITVQRDELGNEKGHIVVHDLAPFASRTILVNIELGVKKQSSSTSADNESAYLMPSFLVQSDDQRVVDISKTLTGNGDFETSTNIYNWVINSMKATGFIEQDHGALYALEKRSGDCTEFMNITLALARAKGIPARGVSGFVYNKSAIVNAADYHNWAEVYVNSAWRVIDPINKNIFKNEQDYNTVRLLSLKKPEGEVYSQALFGADESVKVTMQ